MLRPSSSASLLVQGGILLGLCALFALAGSAALPGRSAEPVTLAFESHGAFFSKETRQTTSIDPQVFTRVPGVPSGAGPQGITHAAGLAPALLDDPARTLLFTADGKPLKITLGQWLGAGGTAKIAAASGGKERIAASFNGLIAQGSYSLFQVTLKPEGNAFAPLDGAGTTNNLVATAQGTGSLTATTPAVMSHTNAVLLVYHSDGLAHGMLRGAPGLTAHHQLIARVP